MSTVTEITIEIYADTRRTGRCRSCRASLQWAIVVESGKKLPFDADRFAVISTRREDETNRLIERADRRTNHWATCPGAHLFKEKGKG